MKLHVNYVCFGDDKNSTQPVSGYTCTLIDNKAVRFWDGKSFTPTPHLFKTKEEALDERKKIRANYLECNPGDSFWGSLDGYNFGQYVAKEVFEDYVLTENDKKISRYYIRSVTTEVRKPTESIESIVNLDKRLSEIETKLSKWGINDSKKSMSNTDHLTLRKTIRDVLDNTKMLEANIELIRSSTTNDCAKELQPVEEDNGGKSSESSDTPATFILLCFALLSVVSFLVGYGLNSVNPRFQVGDAVHYIGTDREELGTEFTGIVDSSEFIDGFGWQVRVDWLNGDAPNIVWAADLASREDGIDWDAIIPKEPVEEVQYIYPSDDAIKATND